MSEIAEGEDGCPGMRESRGVLADPKEWNAKGSECISKPITGAGSEFE
jgi:hypothetical protein